MVSSRKDLIDSLDDEFTGVLPEFDVPNHAVMGVALGKTMGVIEDRVFDDQTETASSELAQVLGQPDHLVFLMLDGFGMNFVETLPEDSFVRRHIPLTMCSLLPTSTGPNLMSLATGAWPGVHGNLGWDVHIPRLGERIQPLTWKLTRTYEPLNEIGFSPAEMLLCPMIPFNKLKDYTHVSPEDIAESTTTQMYGQSHTAGYSSDNDAVQQILDILETAISRAEEKSFNYIYWPYVDGSAHSYGVSHPATRSEVLRAANLVEVLAEALSGKARLVATADHGHLDSPDEVWSTITPRDHLSQFLTCVPAGEPRTLFFHTKPRAQDAFEDLFSAEFGDRFALMNGEDAIEMGLFGPMDSISDNARARVGDFFALSKGRWSIYASDTEEGITIKSMHGGITTEESIVPLIVA